MSFAMFAASVGLLIRDLHADGRIHRVPTAAKPKSNNGAYLFDGERGWVQDWQQSGDVMWWHDPSARPWDEAAKSEWRAKHQEAERQRQQGYVSAARRAREMVAAARMVIPSPETRYRPRMQAVAGHPYLVRKGFPGESGLVLDGELLIPMSDCQQYGQVIGLQRIAPDGEKRFLPGQRARGAVHRFGSGKARELWLCEGYATGLSLREALRHLYRQADVVICFSAGNVEHVASLGIGTHVMADNDASGRGEEAAIKTGLEWRMPPAVGQDANDLHRADGIGAVIELVGRRI